MHPAIRLAYFKDIESGWDSDVASRAEIILEHLYNVYREDTAEPEPTPSPTAPNPVKVSPSKGIFRRAVAPKRSSLREKTQTELQVYFSGIYPMGETDDDVLAWWKVSSLLMV